MNTDSDKTNDMNLNENDQRITKRYRLICVSCHSLLFIWIIIFLGVMQIHDDGDWGKYRHTVAMKRILLIVPLPLFLFMILTETLTPRHAKNGFKWWVVLIVFAYAGFLLHSMPYESPYHSTHRKHLKELRNITTSQPIPTQPSN